MATETLERRFAAIGARVKVVKRPPRSWELIDVETDRRGEYFELRLLGQRWISATVVDEDRDERCLLLLAGERREEQVPVRLGRAALARGGGAGIGSDVGSVEAAKLPPAGSRPRRSRSQAPKNRFARRNVAYARQGALSEQGARAMRHVAFLD